METQVGGENEVEVAKEVEEAEVGGVACGNVMEGRLCAEGGR